jgi:hypothetical protein
MLSLTGVAAGQVNLLFNHSLLTVPFGDGPAEQVSFVRHLLTNRVFHISADS